MPRASADPLRKFIIIHRLHGIRSTVHISRRMMFVFSRILGMMLENKFPSQLVRMTSTLATIISLVFVCQS